jgi:hypothetical protein
VRVLIQAHRAGDSRTLASIKQDGDTCDLFGLQDRVTDAVSTVFLPAGYTPRTAAGRRDTLWPSIFIFARSNANCTWTGSTWHPPSKC